MPSDIEPIWLDVFAEAVRLDLIGTQALEQKLLETPTDAKLRVLVAASLHAHNREDHLLWLATHRPDICFAPGRLGLSARFWEFRQTGQLTLESIWEGAIAQHGERSNVIENFAGALLTKCPRLVQEVLRNAVAGSTDAAETLRWLRAEADFHAMRLARVSWNETPDVVHVLAERALDSQCEVLRRSDEVWRYLELRQIAACTGVQRRVRLVVLAEEAHRKCVDDPSAPSASRDSLTELLAALTAQQSHLGS